jgi:hypothetical protein
MLEAAASIGVIAGSIFIMYEAIKKMATLGVEEYAIGMAAIAGALILIVFITNAMGPQSLAAAGAIAVMAGALWILSEVFLRMQDLEWKQVGIGLAIIAGTLLILAVAGYVMAPIVPVLIALGIAMGLMGLGALAFGAGLFLAALGLIAISGSAYAIAAAIPVVGNAVIEILPRLAAAFAEAIASFIIVLAEKAPEVMEAFKTLILEMLGSILDPEFLPKIARFVLDFITAMITEFEESGIVDKVIKAGWDILKSIIKGVEDNIQEVVDMGFGIIEEIIAGMETGIPDLLIQAKDTLISIIETIEEEVVTEENVARVVAVGITIAGNILAGITQGIIDGAKNVISTFTDLVDDVLRGGEQKAEQDSPSKRTMRMASYMIDGFVIGLETNMYKAKRAMDQFGTAIKRNLEPVVGQMAEHIEREMVFEPKITPVMDLSNIKRNTIYDSMFGIRGNLHGAKVISSVEGSHGEQAIPIGITPVAPQASPTFIQNNYSPKALDRETIYRQTRTHVAKLKEERAFG